VDRSRLGGGLIAQNRGESLVESVYSQASYDLDDITGHYRDSYRSTQTVKAGEASRQSPEPIPAVIISTEPEPEPVSEAWPTLEVVPPHNAAGRTPSRVPVSGSVNFSRPHLPPVDRSDERKQEVLRRNQKSSTSPSPGPSRQPARSPLGQYEHDAYRSPTSTNTNLYAVSAQPSSRAVSPSHPDTDPSRGVSPVQHNEPHRGRPANMSPSSTSQSIAPPRPPRPSSPVSLYSSYSYYPLEALDASPKSPYGFGQQTVPSPANLSPTYVPSQKAPVSPPPASPADLTSKDPTSPEDYLQLGIKHHEANRLADSAVCFEKSATVDGGCGVGMLMWGLAQRHGWGCAKSEQAGFRWLRRAAEVAVEDLERSRKGMDSGAVKSELVLAIYEVGQSFYRGWGVEKDKQMAVSYFRVAAKLGDPDAQQELAFCLANGKGCKKDKKEAAHWYRAAVAQGVSDIGLAWIYKEKYQ